MRNLLLSLLLLISTVFLGECYHIFKTPHPNKKNWFLLHPIDPYTGKEVIQSVTWYVKDSAEALIWIIFLSVWYVREKRRSKHWSSIIATYLIFRVVDLIIYWLNHRQAGEIYGICYLTIAIYAGINTIKEYKKHRAKKS